MARNPIYKVENAWSYQRGVDLYIVQSAEEVADIPESTEAQLAWVLGDGSGFKFLARLPGGEWTEG